METSAIAQRAQMDISGMSTMDLGQVLAKSGYFADAKDAAQAVVKVLAGRELGMGPVASMTGIYIVKGRVTLSANTMAAQIKRSGRYNYRVTRLDDEACEIAYFEGKEAIGVSSFTMAQAREARLHQDWDSKDGKWKDKATWKNFPRNMLFARAMSNGAKWFCPDVFSGPIYTPEELQESEVSEHVDVETGEILDVTPVAVRVTPPDKAATLLYEMQELLAQQGLTPEKQGDYISKLKARHGGSLTENILKTTLAKLENAASKKAVQMAAEEIFDTTPIDPTSPKALKNDSDAKSALWRETLVKNKSAFDAVVFEDDSLEALSLGDRIDYALSDLTFAQSDGFQLAEDMLRYIERHKTK